MSIRSYHLHTPGVIVVPVVAVFVFNGSFHIPVGSYNRIAAEGRGISKSPNIPGRFYAVDAAVDVHPAAAVQARQVGTPLCPAADGGAELQVFVPAPYQAPVFPVPGINGDGNAGGQTAGAGEGQLAGVIP